MRGVRGNGITSRRVITPVTIIRNLSNFVFDVARLKKETLEACGNRVCLLFRITTFIVDRLANHTTKEDLYLGGFLKNNAL